MLCRRFLLYYSNKDQICIACAKAIHLNHEDRCCIENLVGSGARRHNPSRDILVRVFKSTSVTVSIEPVVGGGVENKGSMRKYFSREDAGEVRHYDITVQALGGPDCHNEVQKGLTETTRR